MHKKDEPRQCSRPIHHEIASCSMNIDFQTTGIIYSKKKVSTLISAIIIEDETSENKSISILFLASVRFATQ